jgi:hypothetical protein
MGEKGGKNQALGEGRCWGADMPRHYLLRNRSTTTLTDDNRAQKFAQFVVNELHEQLQVNSQIEWVNSYQDDTVVARAAAYAHDKSNLVYLQGGRVDPSARGNNFLRASIGLRIAIERGLGAPVKFVVATGIGPPELEAATIAIGGTLMSPEEIAACAPRDRMIFAASAKRSAQTPTGGRYFPPHLEYQLCQEALAFSQLAAARFTRPNGYIDWNVPCKLALNERQRRAVTDLALMQAPPTDPNLLAVG